MADGHRIGLGLLIAAKFVCCGGLVLLATGALPSLGMWLANRWYIWVGGAIAVALEFVVNNRRRLMRAGAACISFGGSAEYVTFSPADGERPRRLGSD